MKKALALILALALSLSLFGCSPAEAPEDSPTLEGMARRLRPERSSATKATSTTWSVSCPASITGSTALSAWRMLETPWVLLLSIQAKPTLMWPVDR